MKKALILFVRHPEPGKVKTRLATEIGNEAALKIYVQLLEHTHSITRDLACDKFVFYTERIIDDDTWKTPHFFKRVQRGDDLGERMFNAFEELFGNGYRQVVIIGSDCPGLSSPLIEKAFSSLDGVDVALGPAMDGGYYLLGLKCILKELFQHKNWSTATVLSESLADLKKAGLTYTLLPVLQDIDTKEDLLQLGYSVTE